MEVRRSAVFIEWLAGLRDVQARVRISKRIDRLALGHLGDVKFFDGLGEMRFAFGPGYRVYFVRRGDTIVVLLCGGDKGSQTRDIERAKQMAAEIE